MILALVNSHVSPREEIDQLIDGSIGRVSQFVAPKKTKIFKQFICCHS